MEKQDNAAVADTGSSTESATIAVVAKPAQLAIPPLPVMPKWRFISLVVCLSTGLFLSLLDTTIIATALYTIGVDLESLGSVTWVALAYTLSYLGCTVIFARLADIVGRRNAYIAAFFIFFAFSVACGFAQTLQQLIAFRALQGVGGSGLYSLSIVILPEISPRHKKVGQMLSALSGFVVAIAGVLGPVLGGVITRYTTWRWIFWINAPISAPPIILFIIAWPPPHQLRTPMRRPWMQFDICGSILVIAAAILVVYPFEQAGLEDGSWNKAIFIVPLIIGCLCWIVLFVWEVQVSRKWEEKILTMFPMRLINHRVYMSYALSTVLNGFTYFMLLFALPLRVQVVNSKTPLIAGLVLLPLLATLALGTTLAGVINGNRDHKFVTMVAGSVFMLIGSAALSTLDNNTDIQASIYGFQLFIGLGFGLFITTVGLGVPIECEIRDYTVAQGIIAQFRFLGGSIGIAASTAILGAAQRHSLAGLNISAYQLATLRDSTASMTVEQLAGVRKSYSDSFSTDMKVCAGVSAAAVLVSGLAWRKKGINVEERLKERYIVEVKRRMAEEEKLRKKAIEATVKAVDTRSSPQKVLGKKKDVESGTVSASS